MLSAFPVEEKFKAFAPLVSFIFIVIIFPYKRIKKKEKITGMEYELHKRQ